MGGVWVRPTVHDVASEAGVSLATVDRVLNKRAGVKTTTVARVEAAIARLGFVRDRQIGKHRWVVRKVVEPA